MAPQTKHQKVNNLITEIYELKTQVDVKYREETIIREKMNNFLAQHQSYLGELDKQVEDFSSRIANARELIEDLNRSPEPSQDDEQNIPNITPNNLSVLGEPVESIDPDILANETGEPKEILAENSVGSIEVNEKTRKEEIRKHFARFWHPDHSVTKNNGFMTMLNTAFNESADSADLLAAIPWDDNAWEKPKAGESIGNQWERLTDWLTALEIASERLDQKLSSVKNDWRYPLFSDWDKDAEKHTFFTGLADSKRDEIKRLEEILLALQQEIIALRTDQSE